METIKPNCGSRDGVFSLWLVKNFLACIMAKNGEALIICIAREKVCEILYN